MTHIALDTVFAHEDPDFVAFTGDMVTGYNWDGSQGWFEKQWRKWSMKMSQRRTPYGYALGNHDVEVGNVPGILQIPTRCDFGWNTSSSLIWHSWIHL